jgi:hypothetical protein
MTTQQNKGSPLPEVYQVQCPKPTPAIWSNLMHKAAPKGHHIHHSKSDGDTNSWYKVWDSKWQCQSEEHEGITKVPYEEWKAALTEQEFKVGNWVIVVSDDHTANHDKWIIGGCYQVGAVEKYGEQGVRLKDKDGGYDNGDGWVKNSCVRHATPEEIAKAGGKVEYAVGDYAVITKSQNGHPIGTIVQIKSVESKTEYKVTNGVTTYLAHPDCIRPATEEKIQQAQGIVEQQKSTPAGSNIGRRVVIKNYKKYPEYEGKEGTVTDDKEGGGCKDAITVKMDGGRILCPYRPEHHSAQCQWVDEQDNVEQVPVTVDNAYIGMRVVANESKSKSGKEVAGIRGTISKIYRSTAEVIWDNGKIWLGARISINVGIYDLYIAPGTTVSNSKSNQINNQTTKTKTEYEKHSKQDREHSAIYVCTDNQAIGITERRTTTAICGGGHSGLTKGAHKKHYKAVSSQW